MSIVKVRGRDKKEKKKKGQTQKEQIIMSAGGWGNLRKTPIQMKRTTIVIFLKKGGKKTKQKRK